MHDPVTLPLQEERASFAGDDAEFRRLVTKGALLELVTAGFYRFWLATRIRRYLWGGTLLGGDPLEYLGTGRELLYGFLFALAILAPIYLAYLLIGLAAESYKAFASVPLALFFIAFGQFALYRARRYRLHRTAWRGLRFGMSGSGWAYSWRAMLWGAAIIASLGLALPWADAALERYKMRNTFYGDLQGSFVGRGWELFKRGWWIWLAALFAVIGFSVLVVALAKSGGGPGQKPDPQASALVGLAMLVMGLVAVFFYGAYKAIQWRWWLEGYASVRSSRLRTSRPGPTSAIIGNSSAGRCSRCSSPEFLQRWRSSQFRVSRAQIPYLRGADRAAFYVTMGCWYLISLLSLGALYRIYLIQRVWKFVVRSLTLHGLEAAQEVRAREGTADAVGEGLMDSLDVVGF